jgi:hypothetical protein
MVDGFERYFSSSAHFLVAQAPPKTRAAFNDGDALFHVFKRANKPSSETALEHLIMLALNFYCGQAVEFRSDPLKSTRRLQLSKSTIERLRQGWDLQRWRWLSNQQIGDVVDRIRTKRKRWLKLNDKRAERWLYYVGGAWMALLSGIEPRVLEAMLKPINDNKVLADVFRFAAAIETVRVLGRSETP